jgi:hypothetical protein
MPYIQAVLNVRTFVYRQIFIEWTRVAYKSRVF